MSTANPYEQFRPQIRADVVFGPPMINGNTTVYYVKDRLTEWFYRIGAREYFLMRLMDGHNTIQQIEAAYSATFHRRLTAQSWSHLFTMLGKRSLLVGEENTSRLAELVNNARTQRHAKERSIFYRRFSLPSPERFLAWLLPWVRFAFHPVFVVPALLGIGLLELFFVLHAQTAVADLLTGMPLYLNLPFVVLLCASVGIFLAVHEIAHGLACTYFGGTVSEIGIAFRYFLPCAYCKIDDVVLFHNRWHRVATAFAGIFVNLLMVIPFAWLWWASPIHSQPRVIGAFILVFMNLFILLNCLPFADLDGYLMLSYTLNMVDLRQHATRAWQFRRQEQVSAPSKSRVIYFVYGVFSLVYLLAVLAGSLFLLMQLLHWRL